MGKKKGGGKSSQGRAKQKQKAQRGGNSGASAPYSSYAGSFPPRSGRSRGLHFVDDDINDDDDSAFGNPTGFHGFAMNGQGKSATRAQFSNTKLRNHAIAFVSAGVNASTPLREQEKVEEQDSEIGVDEDEDQDSDDGIDDSAITTNIMPLTEIDTYVDSHSKGIARMTLTENVTEPSPPRTKHASTSSKPYLKTAIPALDGAADTPEDVSFVVDTEGDSALTSKLNIKITSPPKARAASPTPSDSSEEVVVFSGRSRPTVINDPIRSQVPPHRKAPKPAASPSALPHRETQENISPQPQQAQVTDDLLVALGQAMKRSENSEKHATAVKAPFAKTQLESPQDHWVPAPSQPYWRAGATPKQTAPASALNSLPTSHEETGTVSGAAAELPEIQKEYYAAETITSLQAEWRQTLGDKKTAKKAPAATVEHSGGRSKGSNRRSKRARKMGNRALRNSALSDDDSDGEAAYDDYMANLLAQMDGDASDQAAENKTANSFDVRPALENLAAPSLVVDGREIADDEVLPGHLKVADGDGGDADESVWTSAESDDGSELRSGSDELDETSSFGSSDLEREIEYDEQEQWEDEADLRQRRFDRMTDEQLARLLAKQDELGLGTDELIIDDGEYVSMSDGFGDVDAARKGLSSLQTLLSGAAPPPRSRRKGRKNRDPTHFPDASLLADSLDQYGENEGFDIMDLDRPSLRPTKKGRKHNKLPPGLEYLSDEDLRNTLTAQYAHDRAKKAQKKLEREALRTEGLLGTPGRKAKADLTTKYRNGMTMHDVHDELRAFLLDPVLEQRAFPPMAKHERKNLHEICVALGLDSRSQGAGNKRFAVLNKTSRTLPYSEDTFSRILAASDRGFLANRAYAKKMGGGKKGAKRVGGGGQGGGFNKHATSLRHGDIVGAGAEEISADSVGHRLMEKMGWSKGMALGKDGEGLLVPVQQKMRIGTAGLG